MRNRHLILMSVVALATAALMMLPVPAAAQAPSKAPVSTPVSTPAAKSWKAPRTPEGVADLQGYWTNSTLTPLERPKGLGSKEFYTDQEIAEAQKKDRERLALNVAEGLPTEPGTAADGTKLDRPYFTVSYDFGLKASA